MPTSPRNLTGRTGRYKRAAQLSNLRDDEGIVPYAKHRMLPSNEARFYSIGVPSTPGPAAAPSEGTEGRGIINPLLGEGGRAKP